MAGSSLRTSPCSRTRTREPICECLQLRQGEHWAGAEVYIVEKTIYLYQHGIFGDAE